MGRALRLATLGVPVGGGGATFSPLDIDGLLLWLDASDSATLFQDAAATTPATDDGHPVGCWQSKAGTGITGTQAVDGVRPTLQLGELNSKSVVRFDGTDDKLVLNVTHAASDYTMVFVVNPTDNANSYLLDVQTGRFVLAHRGALGLNISCYYGGVWHDIGAAINGAQLLEFYFNSAATAAQVFRNGVQVGANDSYTQQALGGTIGLGGRYATNDASIAADFAEVLIYDSALSDGDRAAVRSYVKTKWGLSF